MLERGEVLLTWQLLREPVNRESLPIPASHIGDHRKAYLDYEGPLTGNRGTVRRVDYGSLDIVKNTPKCLRLVLKGKRLEGLFTLQKVDCGWVLEASDPSAETSSGW